jgi:2',3'-cyclic-nucleotide 2'-phosphodiesterase (5'-nucleotidase family)
MTRWLLVVLGAFLLIATAAHAVDLGTTATPLDGRAVKNAETNYGNFLTDAVRRSAGADIAIAHAMAFREDAFIDKGLVTDQAIRNSLSLPTSKIATLQMTPAVLRAVVQRAFGKYPAQNVAFLQMSGMTVTYDCAQPAAARVAEIRVNGRVIDTADVKTTYTIAMPLELANGAVGYFLEFNAIKKSLTTLDFTILDAITQEFTREKGEIAPKIEGRIIILNEKAESRKE